MTVNELFALLLAKRDWLKRMIGYNDKPVEYWRAYAYGIENMASSALAHCDDYLDKHSHKPSRREKKEFTRHITFTATGMDVAINGLYGNEMEEGKEYTSHEKPWKILELGIGKDKIVLPIYVDDPGESFYTIYKGEIIGTGSFCFFPEEEIESQLIYYILGEAFESCNG